MHQGVFVGINIAELEYTVIASFAVSADGHSPNQQSIATSTSSPATDHAHNVADKTNTAVPQKPLVSEQFLPQVKAAAFRNRLTWKGREQCGTGGLAPHHPLIQDWKRKRRTNTLPKSPSPLTQHHISLSDSSTTSLLTSNASLISRNKNTKHPHSGSSESQNIKSHSKKNELLKTAMRCCQDKDFFESRNGRHCHESNDTEKLKKTCSCAEQMSHNNSTVLPNIGLTSSDSTLNSCSMREKDRRTPFRKVENGSQIVQDVCPPLARNTQNTRHISTHDQSSNKPDMPHCDTQVYPFCGTTSSRESTTVGSVSGAELLIASTGSLAHLTSSRSELSSVPSLPTIQSNIQTDASNSKMDPKGTDHERRSSSLCQRAQRSRDHPCTVVNLRIPFGKIEEWDVPQAKRQNRKKSAVSVDGVRLGTAGGDGGIKKTAEDGESDQIHSANDKTTPTLRTANQINV